MPTTCWVVYISRSTGSQRPARTLDKFQRNVTVYFACIDAITLCKPQHISLGLFKLSHSFHGF